jgi:adenine-specific DNA-methyltransferase
MPILRQGHGYHPCIGPEAFERVRGTETFPFKPGMHKRIAVKVIDSRGNEVMKVTGMEVGT